MSDLGRPKIEFDWEQFEKLCALQCTLIEIAEWFGCSPDTIERRVKEKFESTFADLYKKKSSKGKISLRRKQFEVAMSGNVTMLVWLGKQHLEQRDKPPEEQDRQSTTQVILSREAAEELLRLAKAK